MKLAIGATLAAFTVAGAAAADMPDALGYIVCHGERTGEVFVLSGKPGGITDVPSHPGVEVFEQDDGLTLIDPAGPVYKLGLGDSFMLRDGRSYPMSCEDKTETFAAGAETMARRQLADLRRELDQAKAELSATREERIDLEERVVSLLTEQEALDVMRRRSSHLIDRLPENTSLGLWLQKGEVR